MALYGATVWRSAQLSGGQRQRVALAVQPRVLLLDEPLTALDAKLKEALRDLRITAVHVTDDQNEALAIADRPAHPRARPPGHRPPYLRAAVRAFNALPQRPHAAVLTGDLTDFGRAAEYEHLAGLLASLAMPLYLLPGNHDDRVQLRHSFAHHPYLGDGEFVQYSVSLGEHGLRLVALDTVEPGAPSGRLCARRLQWLADTLQRHRGEPVVIAMHHPPFETLIGHMDRVGLVVEAASCHPGFRRGGSEAIRAGQAPMRPPSSFVMTIVAERGRDPAP